MPRIPFAFAALLLALAVPAAADDDDEEGNEWLRSGWYISLNGSYNLEDIKSEGNAPADNSLGAGIRTGWHFYEYFAAELEFQWINSFDFKGMQPTDSFAGLNYWVWTFGINGRAYLPLPVDEESFWNRIQPYLMGGIGLQQADPRGGAHLPSTGISYDDYETSGSFYGKVGGGIDFYITKNWGLGAEVSYMMPVSETSLGQTLRYAAVNWNFLYRF